MRGSEALPSWIDRLRWVAMPLSFRAFEIGEWLYSNDFRIRLLAAAPREPVETKLSIRGEAGTIRQVLRGIQASVRR